MDRILRCRWSPTNTWAGLNFLVRSQLFVVNVSLYMRMTSFIIFHFISNNWGKSLRDPTMTLICMKRNNKILYLAKFYLSYLCIRNYVQGHDVAHC